MADRSAQGRERVLDGRHGIDGQTPVDLDELDLVVIEPLPSWVWYQDMADFAEAITDERARRRLGRVIQGKAAFRRFKDELHEEYPSTNSTAAAAKPCTSTSCLPRRAAWTTTIPNEPPPGPPQTARAAAFWVRQLNPSARPTAPGAASRSRGSMACSAQLRSPRRG